MSDIDPTPADSSGSDADQGVADDEAAAAAVPWYKNPVVIAIIVIALAALAAILIWGGDSDDDESATTTTEALDIDELKLLCVAQEGDASDEACLTLKNTLTDQEKADISNGCLAGDPDACRLLELIGEPVPTPPTTAPSGGNTIIVIPPAAPDEPTPPEPTIPDLPDPTLDELVEACLAEDGDSSQDACQYLADNLTDSQKDAIRTQCTEGDEDSCKLLELIGEDVPDGAEAPQD